VIRVLLIAVLIMLIARAFWRVVDGVIEGAGGVPRRGRAQPPGVRLVRDPVCGTHVAPDARLSLTVRGTTHYFCSAACRDVFQQRT
jgi:uncharacterized protein